MANDLQGANGWRNHGSSEPSSEVGLTMTPEIDETVHGRVYTYRVGAHRIRIWHPRSGVGGFDWEVRHSNRQGSTWVAGGHEKTKRRAELVAIAVADTRWTGS